MLPNFVQITQNMLVTFSLLLRAVVITEPSTMPFTDEELQTFNFFQSILELILQPTTLRYLLPTPASLDALGHQVYPFDASGHCNNCDCVHPVACTLSAQAKSSYIG
jgi:hypothetical protein